MAEVAEETTYVCHHKQKIAFILSAMRHFARNLQAQGLNVDYVKLDDPDNTGSLTGEVDRAVRRHRVAKVVVTEPGEWRVLEAMQTWHRLLGVPVEIRQDDRFFATKDLFARWARGRKVYRKEFFYREMRRKSGLQMDGDAPVGGHGILMPRTARNYTGGRQFLNARDFRLTRLRQKFWRLLDDALRTISATLNLLVGQKSETKRSKRWKTLLRMVCRGSATIRTP